MTAENDLARKFTAARGLATRLAERSNSVEAEELRLALEELEVISEELLDQTAQLHAIRMDLSAERDRYQQLFDLDPNAQVLTTMTGAVLESNAAAEALFGMDRRRHDWLGQRFPRSERTAYVRSLTAASRSDDVHRDEATIVQPDGDVKRVSLLVRREAGYDGPRLRWTFHDITKTLTHQRRRGEKNAEAQEASDRVLALDAHTETLLSTIGHDLRNPLAAVAGLADTLIKHIDQLDDGMRATLLNRIRSSAGTIEQMLDALLERARRGAVDYLEVKPVDLIGLVGETLATLDIGEHPIDVTDDVVLVRTDAMVAQRIIANVVSNAIAHTPPRTPIWIKVEGSDDEVVLLIEDAGPGMPEAARKHLVARRLTTPEGEDQKYGVGLNLIARFAAMIGARVWIQDRDGGGTRVCIAFPRTSNGSTQPSSI